MIEKKKYQRSVRAAKELLSPSGGIFTESMGPVIGYPVSHHGSIIPLGTPRPPTRTVYAENKLGKTLVKEIELYKERIIYITENEPIKVYADELLKDQEVEIILGYWSMEFLRGWLPEWMPDEEDEEEL